MIESFINITFNLINTIIKIILAPLDIIVMNYLPSINVMTEHIKSFLELCLSCVGWALDLFSIPSEAISLIVLYFFCKYTIYFTLYSIKLVIGWVRSFI